VAQIPVAAASPAAGATKPKPGRDLHACQMAGMRVSPWRRLALVQAHFGRGLSHWERSRAARVRATLAAQNFALTPTLSQRERVGRWPRKRGVASAPRSPWPCHRSDPAIAMRGKLHKHAR
jgi:hypothetical protein